MRRASGAGTLDAEAVAELGERLRRLAAGDGSAVDASHDSLLLGLFTFRDTMAREVMTPRCDIVALPQTATHADALARMVEAGHSRVPVYDGSLDEIVGIVLLKDVVAATLSGASPNGGDAAGRPLVPLLREPFFVPDSKRIGELLPELRAQGMHMAIVLDEFGGTEGLVTLEDILEEIVGDIYDEHDEPEIEFRDLGDGVVLIDGGVAIDEVIERLGITLPDEDYDTIGGYVFGTLGRVPAAGDAVAVAGGELRVEDVHERRITRVRFTPAPPPEDAGP